MPRQHQISFVALLFVCAGATALAAETPPDPPPTGRVRVAASERYDKGRVHRFAGAGRERVARKRIHGRIRIVAENQNFEVEISLRSVILELHFSEDFCGRRKQ